MMGPPTRSASATAGERRFRLSPSLALTAAIPLIYVIVFAVFLVRTGDTDWDQILSFHELSLWNGKLAGPAKQWNPLMRGGMSLAGDPQVPIFSPSMILARVIDPAAAIKISCLLFLGLGALGAWLLARDFYRDPCPPDPLEVALLTDPRFTQDDRFIDAMQGLAHLTEDEQHITDIELRGNARVIGGGTGVDAMSARDMNLHYAAEGQTLEHARLLGGGAVAMTGQKGTAGRQFLGETLDMLLAPDGSLTKATGRENVRLDLPASQDAATRT